MWTPRKFTMQWLVANSSLAHGLTESPLKKPELSFAEMRRGLASRSGYPVLRWEGDDGPRKQLFALHFTWYRDAQRESSALQPLGAPQELEACTLAE